MRKWLLPRAWVSGSTSRRSSIPMGMRRPWLGNACSSSVLVAGLILAICRMRRRRPSAARQGRSGFWKATCGTSRSGMGTRFATRDTKMCPLSSNRCVRNSMPFIEASTAGALWCLLFGTLEVEGRTRQPLSSYSQIRTLEKAGQTFTRSKPQCSLRRDITEKRFRFCNVTHPSRDPWKGRPFALGQKRMIRP